MSRTYVHIDCTPDFKVGDPEPEGYAAWHAWAEVQHKGGLHQTYCPVCQKWLFPQTVCGHEDQRQTFEDFKAETREIKKWVRKNYPTGEDRYRKQMKALRKNPDYQPEDL